MIKIKLNNNSTKPLDNGTMNKLISKSIQNRIKDIQAVNPKLLKIKKGIITNSNIKPATTSTKFGVTSNEEVFDCIKQQLLEEKFNYQYMV